MIDVIFIFHFGLFFALKIKIKKNEKNTCRYHHFAHVYHKLGSDGVWLLRYGAQQMDGEMDGATDRWMEKMTYRGGCPT